MGGVRVDRVITRGMSTLAGQRRPVDNNVWIVGDDRQVVVIDAAHDPSVISAAVGERRVTLIVATHGHADHVNAAGELSDLTGAPVALHPADLPLWRSTYPDREPDRPLRDGDDVEAAPGCSLAVLHTPGHSPGGVSLFGAIHGDPTLFSGDTLVRGGPGATGGRAYSDFPTILSSIRNRLLVLPSETIVHAGHGEDTTVGEESVDFDDWVLRGY